TQGATPESSGAPPCIAITMILKEISAQLLSTWSQKVPLFPRAQQSPSHCARTVKKPTVDHFREHVETTTKTAKATR
ncbi:hypothetical protein, partial [Acidovorax sp. HMWF018]|uniref:hypothetical protein n=1 Tax=Acidovorax sp. HMWF018 TaxID=2056855 RepID=UPI001E42AF6A